MCKNLKRILFLCFSLFQVVSYSQADEPLSIVAVVNNGLITSYDLDKRMDMVLNLSGLTVTPATRKLLRPQILRSMIDELLQEQVAAQYGVKASDENVNASIREIEQSQNLLPGDIAEKLASINVPLSALKNQIHANLVWVELVRSKYKPIVHVTDYEIDQHINRQKRQAEDNQYYVQEIFLLTNEQAPVEDALRFAKKIREEIINGASFEALAQQFSDSRSAIHGGAIGWTNSKGLDDALGNVVETLKPGEVSQPILANGGVYLLRVNEIKNPQYETTSTIDFAEMVVPLYFIPNESALQEKREEVQKAVEHVSSVEQLEEVAKKLGASYTLYPNKALDALPPDLQSRFKNLPLKKPSAAYRGPKGFYIFFIDNRETNKELVGVDSPREARVTLMNKKLEAMANSFLRELRRKAHVKLAKNETVETN